MTGVLWSKWEVRIWTFTLFLGTATVYAARVALPICAVAVGKDYKWTKSDSGTVLSCFFWGYATTQVLGGWLADRYGGENVLSISTLFWSFITFFSPNLFYLAYQTPFPIFILVLLRVAMGVSQGFHFPCMASIVSRRLMASEKGRVFGIVMAGSHAGTVICGSAGSVILEQFGWEQVFYFIGALGIAWWVFLRYMCTRSCSRRQKSDSVGAESGTLLPVLPSSKEDDRRGPSPPAVPWLTLISKVPFWAAFCAHYCGANAYFTLFSWLPSYFTENYPDAKGWVFNVVPNLAIVSTALTAPWLASGLVGRGYSMTDVRKLMEGSSLLGLALCLFVVSLVSTYHAALLFLTAAMALRGLHHAGVSVNPQDFAPNHTGAVFGLMNSGAAIPGFVGVYVAGHILDLTHSWAYVFFVTGFQCICGMIIYVLFGTAKQII